MMTPTIYGPPAQDERKDLTVALKLLAGKDCIRDAPESQKMLLRLAESSDRRIAEDALKILQRGLHRGWLEDKAPLYSELTEMAQSSLSQRVGATKAMIAIGLGLVLLALLGVLFFARAVG